MPVLEGEGRVIGVVSEADLLPKEEFRDTDPSLYEERQRLSDVAKAGAVTAEDLMSTPAITVHPDVTLAHAARIMAVRHVKRLPVVDDVGMLQGIVSRADLLKVFLRSDEEIEEEVRRTVVSYLFPAFSHAIHVNVDEGVVTLRGHIRDTSLISVAVRLVRAVEGVVDVEPHLTGESGPSAGAEGTQ
jgi:CBS-domain-containing membrane protein